MLPFFPFESFGFSVLMVRDMRGDEGGRKRSGQILPNSLLSHSSTCSGSHFKPFSCCRPVCGSTQWLNKSLESNVTSLSDSRLNRAKNSGHTAAFKNTTSSDDQLLRVRRADQGVLSVDLVQCQIEDELYLCSNACKEQEGFISNHTVLSQELNECKGNFFKNSTLIPELLQGPFMISI